MRESDCKLSLVSARENGPQDGNRPAKHGLRSVINQQYGVDFSISFCNLYAHTCSRVRCMTESLSVDQHKVTALVRKVRDKRSAHANTLNQRRNQSSKC